jgi:hypothetical protein
MFAAVDAEVRLTVAVQIELAQSDAACDWLLVDRRSYASPCHATSRGSPVLTETSFISRRSFPIIRSIRSQGILSSEPLKPCQAEDRMESLAVDDNCVVYM